MIDRLKLVKRSIKQCDDCQSEGELIVGEKYDVTFGSHISELAKLRDEARVKKAWSAAVNAEVARGKAAGLYIEQKIIRTGKLEDLTIEELESRMKQIMEDYSPILEGIEVEELKSKVKEKVQRSSKSKDAPSNKNSLHLKNATNGEDIPITE